MLPGLAGWVKEDVMKSIDFQFEVAEVSGMCSTLWQIANNIPGKKEEATNQASKLLNYLGWAARDLSKTKQYFEAKEEVSAFVRTNWR